MSKKFEVTYHRKSQVATYKDQSLVPVHSITVEATSAPKAKKIAGEVEGRIIISAKLVEDDAVQDTTESSSEYAADSFAPFLNDISDNDTASEEQAEAAVDALFPDSGSTVSEQEPPALSEIDQATEELLGTNSRGIEAAPVTEADEAQDQALLGDDESEAQDTTGEVGADPQVETESAVEPVVEVTLHNGTLDTWVHAAIVADAVNAIADAVPSGLATLQPLGKFDQKVVEYGGSLNKFRAQVSNARVRTAAYNDGHNTGFDEGYDIGYDEGYESGTEEVSLSTVGYSVRLASLAVALIAALVFAFTSNPFTAHHAFATVIVTTVLSLATHFSARNA